MEKEKKSKETRSKLSPVFGNLEIAWRAWWKNLKKIVFIYLWGLLYALIPMAVIAVLLAVNYFFGGRLGIGFRVLTIVIAGLGFLVSLYFFIRSYLGIFLLVKHDYSGQEKALFKETRQFFWPYIGLSIMIFLFVLPYFFLLVIPGIVWAILCSFASYILFFENKRGLEAISRSVKLASGYFWPLLGRFLFIGVIVWVFSLLISIPLALTDAGSLFNSIWNGVVQVVSFLIGPIVLIYTCNIYKELVAIKK